MSLNIEQSSRGKYSLYLFLKLLFFSILTVACGGVVSAPKQKPEVKSTDPRAGKEEVSLNKNIFVTFSEKMDENSVKDSFSLEVVSAPPAPVFGTVSLSDTIAKFDPDNDLAPSTEYKATVTTGARDLSGDSLGQNHVWTFMTGTEIDKTPPTVKLGSAKPPDPGPDVSFKNVVIEITFDEAVDKNSFNMDNPENATFSLKGGGDFLKGTVDFSNLNKTVQFIIPPPGDLQEKTSYKAIVRGAKDETGNLNLHPVKDTAGNSLLTDFSWSFKTKKEGEDD